MTEWISVKDRLLTQLWSGLYSEEDEWERKFRGTQQHDNWFLCYRLWLQSGFEIAIKVLTELMEKEWKEYVEPKRGRWINERCSECGKYVYIGDADNYCPHYGALMKGSDTDEAN